MEILSGIKKAYESIESDINAAVLPTPTSDKVAASSDDGSADRSTQPAPATTAKVTQSEEGWDTSWGDEETVSPRSRERTSVSSTKTPEKLARRDSAASGAMSLEGKRPSAALRTPKAAAATPKTSSADVSGSPGGASGNVAMSPSKSPNPAGKTASMTPGKASALDTMSRDDVIKYLRRQMALLKTSKSNCDEMTKRCAGLEEENAGLKAKQEPARKAVDVEDIQAQLATISTVRDSLAEQLTASMSQQDALQRDLKIQSQEIEGLAASKSETQERLLSTEAERDKFRQAVQQLRKKITSSTAAKSSTAAEKDAEARAVELRSAHEESTHTKQALAELQATVEALRGDLKAKTGECTRLTEALADSRADALQAKASWQSDARAVLARHTAALDELEQRSRAELQASATSHAETAQQQLHERSALLRDMAQEHAAAQEALYSAHADQLRDADEIKARKLEEQETELNERAQQAVEEVASQLASAKSLVEQLQNKNESLQLQHDASAQADSTAARLAQEELEVQREELSTRVSLLADENAALEASVKQERGQLAAVRDQHKSDIDRLQEERDTLQSQLSQATAIAQDLQESSAAAAADGAEKQLSELTMEHATLGANLEEACERNTELQRELDEVKLALAQSTAIAQDLQESSAAAAVADDAEKQLSELTMEHATLGANLEEACERNIELQRELDEVKLALAQSTAIAQDLQESSAAAAADGAEKQLSELTMEHATLGANLEEACERNTELQRELDEVKMALAQSTEKHVAASDADAVDGGKVAVADPSVIDELQKEVSRLETELVTVQTALSSETARQRSEVESLCATHSAAACDLQGKLAASETLASGATALAKELEEQTTKVTQLQDERQSLRQQLTEAQHIPPVQDSSEYQDVAARLEEATGAMSPLRDQVAALSSEAEQRSSDVLRLESELAAAREESAGLSTQLASLQQDTAEAAQASQAARAASDAESAQVTQLASQLSVKQAELTKLQERFAKLKAALVKMKAESAELKETNAALKTRASSVGESATEDLKKLRQEVLGAQSSRADVLLQLEEAEKKRGQAEEKLQRTLPEVDSIRSQLKGSEQRSDELESEAAEMRGQLDGILKERGQLKEHIVQLQSSVASQDTMLAEERKRVTEERALVSGLRQEADSLRAKYEDQSRKRESVEKDLERASKEASKSSVMNLELDDYERTITTLESRIKDHELKLADANEVYERQVSISDGYKKDIIAVEAQKTHAEERANKIKVFLGKSRKELGEAQKQISSLESGEKELRHQLENAAQSTESGKMEFSEMAAELVALRQQVETVSDAHRQTEQLLQQRLSSSQAELSTAKNQLTAVQADYETYKVRVHSVLKQQKSKPQAQEDASLKELCDQRADSVQLLNRQLSELTETLSTSVKDREALEDDLEQLNDRHSILQAESKQQERDFRERLDKLQSQHASSELERVETMRQLNSQSEALSTAFKEETARVRDQHASEVVFLSDKNGTLQDQLSSVIGQLASAEETVAQLRARVTTEQADVMIGGGKSQHRAIVKPLPLRAASTDIEGAEEAKWVSPPPESPVGGSSVVASFEQLLNSPVPLADDQVSTAGSEASTRIAASLKKQVQHVTELLSESEANAQLLTQQVAILKEEIRRLERNEARREEVANLEYLKNIILKFLSADAKGQKDLIPILDTLLKLSPQEKLFVEKAAAGRAPAVPNLIPDTEGARRAANAAYSNVSSYMRSWTGY